VWSIPECIEGEVFTKSRYNTLPLPCTFTATAFSYFYLGPSRRLAKYCSEKLLLACVCSLVCLLNRFQTSVNSYYIIVKLSAQVGNGSQITPWLDCRQTFPVQSVLRRQSPLYDILQLNVSQTRVSVVCGFCRFSQNRVSCLEKMAGNSDSRISENPMATVKHLTAYEANLFYSIMLRWLICYCTFNTSFFGFRLLYVFLLLSSGVFHAAACKCFIWPHLIWSVVARRTIDNATVDLPLLQKQPDGRRKRQVYGRGWRDKLKGHHQVTKRVTAFKVTE